MTSKKTPTAKYEASVVTRTSLDSSNGSKKKKIIIIDKK